MDYQAGLDWRALGLEDAAAHGAGLPRTAALGEETSAASSTIVLSAKGEVE
ncbi:MAG: hypothetical protein LBF50_04770 [Azoarcus sp.]|jgi:hypothetical protein|nr:hypothetical protein [Azoarcus sp.]